MKQDVILEPCLTVRETLRFYLLLRNPVEVEGLDPMLEEMKIEHLADCRIHGLSGGERKRIMLVYMLLDRQSPLLFLDEPFSGLDDENIELVFDLLERCKAGRCIVAAIHHLPGHLMARLDEKWTVSNGTLNYDSLMDGEKGDKDFEATTMNVSLMHQAWILGTKSRLVCQRHPLSTLIRLFVPMCVGAIQGFMIGFLRTRLNAWLEKGALLPLFQYMFNYSIMLFTMSSLPLISLGEHIQKRSTVLHEASQRIFSYQAYLLQAIVSDQILMACTAMLLCSISFTPSPVFFVFFAAMLLEILTTNLYVWLMVYGLNMSYDVSQLILAAYLSLSFLLNTPSLNPRLVFLRRASMSRAHTEMMMNALLAYHPSPSIQQMGTMLGMQLPSTTWPINLIMMAVPICLLVILCCRYKNGWLYKTHS
jgi:energy-coupling factor transporter ATP-binding protein EcfA2